MIGTETRTEVCRSHFPASRLHDQWTKEEMKPGSSRSMGFIPIVDFMYRRLRYGQVLVVLRTSALHSPHCGDSSAAIQFGNHTSNAVGPESMRRVLVGVLFQSLY